MYTMYIYSVNRRKDGSLGGMVVEKCKFLQESGCKGKHRTCPTIIHHIEYYIYVCVIYPTYTCISHNPLSDTAIILLYSYTRNIYVDMYV